MNERILHEEAPAAGGQPRAAIVIALAVAVIGLAGFAGWFANGDSLFWSLLQAGLAWCM
jgi:hypothetical protein